MRTDTAVSDHVFMFLQISMISYGYTQDYTAPMIYTREERVSAECLASYLHRILRLPQRSHHVDPVRLTSELLDGRILVFRSATDLSRAIMEAKSLTSSLMKTLCC